MPVSTGPNGPPSTLKKYFTDPSKTPPGGAWGPDGKVVTPSKTKTKTTTPGKSGGKTKSAFQKWLTSNAPLATPPGGALAFDPTKGYPTAPQLTTYPGLDASTLPDGSEVPDTPAHAFARTRASLLDPKAFAKLEGMQSYQPIIDALSGQQSRLQSGIPQANSMMDTAYGSAADASARGADVVRNSNAQANQSLTDLAARLAQVAGGDPTAAAAVGQASANQQADNSRFASVAEQAQADQAAAAQRDLGTAKLAYKGATDSSIANLASQAAQAKQQGSQAQGKAIEEALSFNDQQRTSALNRDVSSQEAWLAGQIAGPQITAANLANSGTRAGMKLNVHNAQVNDWTNINAGKRQQYLDAVTRFTDKATAQQMKAALIKGQTPAAELALADPQAYNAIAGDLDQTFRSKSGPIADPGTTYSQAIKQLHSQYPDSSSKAIKALASRYASAQMVVWNQQHSKGQQNSGKTWKLVNGAPALVKA